MLLEGSAGMPNRVLREGILKSPRVNHLSERAELFYRRLMSVVDDFGRFDALPVLLRAAVYPLRIDKIGDDDVQGFLDECVAARLLAVYVVGGQPYLELIDFRQHARAKESRFPAPEPQAQRDSTAPAPHMQRTRTAYAPGDGDGDGDGDGGGGGGGGAADASSQTAPPPPQRSPASHGSRIPDDFPDVEALAFCRSERPDLDPQRVRDKFRDYWLGVPGAKGRKADWPATWRNFVRSEHAPLRPNGRGPPFARPPTAAERAAANVASLTGRNRNPTPVTIDVEPTPPTARLG